MNGILLLCVELVSDANVFVLLVTLQSVDEIWLRVNDLRPQRDTSDFFFQTEFEHKLRV